MKKTKKNKIKKKKIKKIKKKKKRATPVMGLGQRRKKKGETWHYGKVEFPNIFARGF